MPWSETSAIVWTERAIAIAVVLQTIEQLQLRRTCADDGVFAWPILRREHVHLPWPLRVLLACVLPYRPFVALLWVRLIGAALLCATGWPALAPLLLFCQVAICVRFRGTFNGGSDSMTVVILLALCVAHVPGLARAGLAYIAVQLALSYTIAGLVKLREPAWRNGEALRAFLGSPLYGAPAFVQRLASPGLSRVLAGLVIVFECGFPIAFIDPRVCAAFIGAGLCFHLANAVVFGLNRFLFAWAAAYPALWFCSQLLRMA